MENRKPLNSFGLKKSELKQGLHRSSTSSTALRTERSFWNRASERNAPTAFVIWAAQWRALPQCSKTYHAPK